MFGISFEQFWVYPTHKMLNAEVYTEKDIAEKILEKISEPPGNENFFSYNRSLSSINGTSKNTNWNITDIIW